MFEKFLLLPKDIRNEIYNFSSYTPSSYYNLSLVCKEANKYTKSIEENRRKSFLRTITSKKSTYTILPNGNREGKHIWINLNFVKEESYYRNDKLDGTYKRWYTNGKIMDEGFYKDGNIEGIFTSYYNNGQKEEKANYINNKKEGKYERWYDNGNKHVECFYVNDKAEGTCYTWYENGQKAEEITYTNGKKTKYISWSITGVKEKDKEYRRLI